MCPLHTLFEIVYTQTGKPTKHALSRVFLSSLVWSETLLESFYNWKNSIASPVTLFHRKEDKILLIHTYSSDNLWSVIVILVTFEELSQLQSEKCHKPLSFHFGRFTATELGSVTLESEEYALVTSIDRSNWVSDSSSGFDFYKDHNNIILTFDPKTAMPNKGRGALLKKLRYCIFMSTYSYFCVNISG